MNKKGFTLIELMVVMAIIAVLAVLIVGAITVARNTAKETKHRANAKTLKVSLEAYKINNKKYPDTAAMTNTSGQATTWRNFYDTAAFLGVTIQESCGVTDKMEGWMPSNGGGVVDSNSTTFTIKLADASCTKALANDDLTP